jgi:hypothetical protein
MIRDSLSGMPLEIVCDSVSTALRPPERNCCAERLWTGTRAAPAGLFFASNLRDSRLQTPDTWTDMVWLSTLPHALEGTLVVSRDLFA